ncbi:hypothetical protein NMG60_11032558 [Bertholletia excelsa]
MALSSLRLRRAVSLSSALIKHQRRFFVLPAISSSPSLSSVPANPKNRIIDLVQPHHLRPSLVSLYSSRASFRDNNSDEIGPDTILFEGCDYNHWLITMDFPKDPEPTREEMIETYLQTLAKVVGSYEEAKKRMYAFSTTTYRGFQCVVTEEVSEKFKGLPGVVFVLPDSYIDPVNKEYGGDKYENGVITPRPPPAQYGRQGGRYGDRNRNFNRNQPRGPIPNQQVNPAYGNQGPVNVDNRSFGQQQNPMPMDNAPGGRNPMPSYQRQPTYGQSGQGYNNPQGGRIQHDQSYMPPGQRDSRGENWNYRAPQGVSQGQGAGGGYGQTPGDNYGQGVGGNFGQMASGSYGQGTGGNYGQGGGGSYGPVAGGNYGQRPAGGNYGQGAGGNYGQATGGNYGQGGGSYGQTSGGNYGQGAEGNYGHGGGAAYRPDTGFGHGQNYPGQGQDPRYFQGEQRNNMQGEQRNPAAAGHGGADQGRY